MKFNPIWQYFLSVVMVSMRCHDMKYYDRVDWNLPKNRPGKKSLLYCLLSWGPWASVSLSIKSVDYLIPRDLEALTFPVSVTVGKSSKIPVGRSCTRTHCLNRNQVLWLFWAAPAGWEQPWMDGMRWLKFWPGECCVGIIKSCCKVYLA